MERAQSIAYETMGLSLNSTYKQGYNRYRYLVRKHHPDKGGDAEEFIAIQNAWKLVKPILKQLRLVVLVRNNDRGYYRQVVASNLNPTHVDWINYIKTGKVFLIDTNDVVAPYYDLPQHEKKLEDGVNCRIEIVSRDKHHKLYGHTAPGGRLFKVRHKG